MGAKSRRNVREVYLFETLRLSHDPFAVQVAEQELHRRGQPADFFDYYIDPSPALRETLREARSAFVFGPPGSGKTTLRYLLEADSRTQTSHTLVVTYELSHNIPQALAPDEHWRRLAEELAVDLFIQIVEQFNALNAEPTLAQRQAWRDQMALAWRRLRRTAARILNDPDVPAGLQTLWRSLGRPAVSYVETSGQLHALLKDCLPLVRPGKVGADTGESLLRTGLQAARLWGFPRVFVMVDGVDASRKDPEFMYALIEPLLQALPRWQAQGMFFKFFLPLELQTAITDRLGMPPARLPFSPFETIMAWNDGALRQLLAQRFRAARTNRAGFDEFADRNLEERLDELLVRTAAGSPRRLLQLVSGLIDAHAGKDPERQKIGAADWNHMCRRWKYDPPAPRPLPRRVT